MNTVNTTQKIILLCFVALALFGYPLLSMPSNAVISGANQALYLYLFIAWGLCIILAAAVLYPQKKEDE